MGRRSSKSVLPRVEMWVGLERAASWAVMLSMGSMGESSLKGEKVLCDTNVISRWFYHPPRAGCKSSLLVSCTSTGAPRTRPSMHVRSAVPLNVRMVCDDGRGYGKANESRRSEVEQS